MSRILKNDIPLSAKKVQAALMAGAAWKSTDRFPNERVGQARSLLASCRMADSILPLKIDAAHGRVPLSSSVLLPIVSVPFTSKPIAVKLKLQEDPDHCWRTLLT